MHWLIALAILLWLKGKGPATHPVGPPVGPWGGPGGELGPPVFGTIPWPFAPPSPLGWEHLTDPERQAIIAREGGVGIVPVVPPSTPTSAGSIAWPFAGAAPIGWDQLTDPQRQQVIAQYGGPGIIPAIAPQASAPILSTISPNPVSSGQPLVLILRGSGFVPGAKATYSIYGGDHNFFLPDDFPNALYRGTIALDYVSASELHAQFPDGLWPPQGDHPLWGYQEYVSILNPDGQQSGDVSLAIMAS